MKAKTIIISILVLLSLFFISSCVQQDNGTVPKEDPSTETPTDEEEEEIKDPLLIQIEEMSIKEKIGQLMIVGFDGDSNNDYIENLITEYNVGGFVLFARNIINSEQTLNLVNDIKTTNKNKIPLFMGIDEEGGRVSRFPDDYQRLPAALTIGNINSTDLSYELGTIMAKRLKSFGFNLNFAPVLDINSNPNNPVIGDRSFGDNEEVVSKNALSVYKGLDDNNIISTVKHFPGHGDTEVDSHMSLPVVHKTKEELDKLELIPFKKAIEQEVKAIMIAHILFDKIDEDYPATMSEIFINKTLRKDMGFDGVVFSDDMTMGAIIENYYLDVASVGFLKAGGDVLLICHGQDNPKLVFDAIEKAVSDNKLSEKEIDEKVYRILSLKEEFKLNDDVLLEYDTEKLYEDTKIFLEKLK